jgi:hypothetical protein
MRTKLTALIVACAALAAGAVAHAAPIPVATYTFQSQDDVNAFQKVGGSTCKRKWAGTRAPIARRWSPTPATHMQTWG